MSATHGRAFAARIGAAGEALRSSFRIVLDGQAVGVAQAHYPYVVTQRRELLALVELR